MSFSRCACVSSFALSAMSTLLRIRYLGSRRWRSASAIAVTLAPTPPLPSTINARRSAPSAPLQAAATIARSSRRLGSKMPGVSTSRICASPSSATPINRVRVVCALGLTIATFCPTSALTSVDLPALGAPTTATRPQDWVIRKTRSSNPFALSLSKGGVGNASRHLLQQRFGGGGFGFLLAGAGCGRLGERAEADADREARRVVRARAIDHFVHGRLAIVRRRPFLQCRLGVLRRLAMRADALRPGTADEGARKGQSPFEIERADQRLHHVAQHIVAVGGAVVACLLAQAQMRAHAVLARDLGAHRPRHQRIQALRQRAFGVLREVFEQPFGDRQPQHAIAEEFEPLVIVLCLA